MAVNVPIWVWALTVLGLITVLALDYLVVDRKPREMPVREALCWVAATVLSAVAFGVGMGLVVSPHDAGQFFAGWITEYSLSVDNLFVFVVIMARFAVPKSSQHRVLLIGVALALILRGAFIAAGAAAIAHFTWVFFIFGAFLVYTAIRLARSDAEVADTAEFRENALVRVLRRRLPVTADYEGSRLVTRCDGRRFATPMLVVVAVIGTTDVMFALDSIPAIFGLTREPYLVFTANMFALLGLRQLYFVIGGLLERLVYLSRGLALILAFIGVKMLFEALIGIGVHDVGPVAVPEIGIELSLGVILGVLAVTTVASLVASRRRERQARSNADGTD
jgi:tellurite resistance protein TerC